MCDKYLLSYYKEIIIDILKDCDESKTFSVNINFVELSGNDPNLGNNFLSDPEKSLEEWNQALRKVQTDLMLQSETNYVYKNHICCRIFSLPLYPEFHRTKFPQNEDTNKFLQVSGTVVRMTVVKILEYQRQYICTKCKCVMLVNAEFDMKNIITPPKKCSNPEDCKGTNMITMELNSEFCKDYQEIKMQETVSKLDVGSMPNSMWVTLEDDLVDSCKPGDNVTVCGLVKRRQNQFVIGKKMDIELVIKTNHLQVNNNNSSILSITPELKVMFEAFWKTYADMPLAARDIILKSICPQLFGLFLVKLAVAVVLAGGSNLHNNSNTGVRVRAEPHLLLVGDPGTGKSQLLRFASKIIPRSVLTTGVGSTAAGLTVTAVMENGEWQLEGGALVMSDGGICCIDEFNTMKEHDRTSIHEAMEQQTISVAKASIVCKLSTRCAILAATNPKGNLDPSQPLNMNVALSSPLLSRFDLILLLRDKIDDAWDSQLVEYIFTSFDNRNSSKLTETINWTIETLQAYFAVIKKNHPVLTEDSNKILSGYYQAQRRKNYRNKSRTTVRLLDSLVRLSQGHARLMFHKEVEIVDAVIAVVLVETAMEADFSVLNLQFNLRNDFPQDPTSNYRNLAEIVLKKLDLEDLLKKEMEINAQRESDRASSNNGSNASPKLKTECKFSQVNQVKAEESSSSGSEHNGKQTVNRFNGLINIRSNTNRRDNELDDLGEGTSGVKIYKRNVSSEETGNENLLAHNKSTKTVEHKKDAPVSKNGEKENKECDQAFIKRTKSRNDINPKKIKRQNKENEIKDDLAALKCMPSVNDVFCMVDYDTDDESAGLNFEEIGNNEKAIMNGKIAEANNKSQNNIAKVVNSNVASNCDENEEIVNEVVQRKENLQKDKPELSQRTRTKSFFNKFRFISKDDQSGIDIVEETVSKQNPFDKGNAEDIGEISFANVQSSTQTEKSAIQLQKRNSDESTFKNGNNFVPVVKKFNFKKITNSENIKPLVVAGNPQSIFENQEDLNDLELNL